VGAIKPGLVFIFFVDQLWNIGLEGNEEPFQILITKIFGANFRVLKFHFAIRKLSVLS
jgi:hypothetical protein